MGGRRGYRMLLEPVGTRRGTRESWGRRDVLKERGCDHGPWGGTRGAPWRTWLGVARKDSGV